VQVQMLPLEQSVVSAELVALEVLLYTPEV
jgi:hypothetical protein